MNDQIKFSCLVCGQHIVCDVTESGRPMLCPSCGANLTVPHVMELPLPPPVFADSDDTPASTTASVPGARRTSGWAIASLISSLSCIGCIPGIICGHLARYKIRRDPALKGKGLAATGLIISYATMLFSLGLAVVAGTWFSARLNEAYQEAHLFMVTNSPANVSAAVQILTNQSAHVQSSKGTGAGWIMDVKDVTIPDSPVSGEIHGADFQLKRAVFRNGNLRFLSTDNQESLMIHGLGDSVANRSLEFQTASANDNDTPKIEIVWKDGGENQTSTFQDGYAMELKFDGAKGRRIRGTIYLCLPDDSKSYLAGTFTVVLPKPKPQPVPAAQ